MRYANRAFKVQQILKSIERAKAAVDHIDVELTDDDVLIVYDKNGDQIRRYDPHRTLKVYHKDGADIKFISGAFGSGKSTGNMVVEVIKQAIKMPKCIDGIKRLELYHRRWDKKRGVFLKEPVHDGNSHAADALRIEALSEDFRNDSFYKVNNIKVTHDYDLFD